MLLDKKQDDGQQKKKKNRMRETHYFSLYIAAVNGARREPHTEELYVNLSVHRAATAAPATTSIAKKNTMMTVNTRGNRHSIYCF